MHESCGESFTVFYSFIVFSLSIKVGDGGLCCKIYTFTAVGDSGFTTTQVQARVYYFRQRKPCGHCLALLAYTWPSTTNSSAAPHNFECKTVHTPRTVSCSRKIYMKRLQRNPHGKRRHHVPQIAPNEHPYRGPPHQDERGTVLLLKYTVIKDNINTACVLLYILILIAVGC